MRRRLLWCACSMVVATSGCSFIVARPTPTKDPGTRTSECRSVVWPVLDVLGAAGLGLGVAGLEAIGHAVGECGKASNASNPGCGTNLALYIPAAIVGASAIYGFWAIAHCSSQLDKDDLPADLAALDHAIEARCGAQNEQPKDGVAASGRLSACGH